MSSSRETVIHITIKTVFIHQLAQVWSIYSWLCKVVLLQFALGNLSLNLQGGRVASRVVVWLPGGCLGFSVGSAAYQLLAFRKAEFS